MEMESDVEHSNPKKKVESLQALAKGPLASSVAKLSGSSRGIPSGEEFHFSYNFSEFKAPIREISEKSESMLATIGSSSSLWGKSFAFPSADDPDDAYDWLVNINDEIFERFDASLDEFQRLRKKEEEGGGRGLGSMGMMDDGFQLVYGKKKKKGVNSSRGTETEAGRNSGSLPSVTTSSNKKATTMARPRVPFHIPTIPRPQEVFNILVNNSNQPFEHVWLQKSEDESRFIHPLERLSVLDFVDRNVPPEIESVKVLPIESTPFALVEEVKGLKELAAKLQNVDEFAVDLEHNQYRSFQGLTCLMQISTRTEDFVVDTLKLRVHVGPYLRELFKDPSKRKVMHGADRDIVWLQRDFGIYVCNLFDTGQASRVLQLERNSLEYLLNHFCGVTANKEYQNADWRLRPIPDEMIKYAREDTHYLLHIYDLMRGRLLATSAGAGNGDSLLLEVYKRSYDICMQLYEKEILTDTSYLHIYGLLGADFNSEQLAIVAGLCQWRDAVGRAEDESTGYILPNKALLEIARQKPITASHLRRLVKLKHPYVERNLGSVVSIIRSSIQNASAFESAAEQLKKGRLETALEENVVLVDESEALSAPEDRRILENMSSQTEEVNVEKGNGVDGHMFQHGAPSVYVKGEPLEQRKGAVELDQCGRPDFLKLSGEAEQIKTEENKSPQELLRESVNDSAVREDMNTNIGDLQSVKVTEATVEVLKKPSRAFGALLGKSASKRKLSLDPKVGMKVEQIKSSVTLPFNSFFGGNEQLKSLSDENLKVTPTPVPKEPFPFTAETTNLEDIILLENNMKDQESEDDLPTAASDDFEHSKNGDTNAAEPPDSGDEPMCLSELSSSFQKCFQSRNNRQTEISQEHDNGSFGLQLKPFDYTAARKQMKFGEDQEEQAGEDGRRLKDLRKDRWKSSVSSGQVQRDEDRKDLAQQARRRQAFPQTGNRTATFR